MGSILKYTGSVFLTCYPISLQKNKPMYWNRICLDGISFILGFFFFLVLGLPWWCRWWRVWLQCKRPWVPSLGQKDPLEKWPPAPVLLPEESHGQRGLVGYSPWGRKESDTTEQLSINSLKRVKVPCSQLTWVVFFLNLLNAGELPKLYWFALLYTCSSENKLSFT